MIQEIKSEIKEQERLAEIKKNQEIAEAKRQEELRQQRKREALVKQAQEWLKKLDIKSEEGLWFEEFSYSYENKLEAAIDYLAALREVRF
jgi:ABC-type branched-subunit amino acid transport system ATPase component